MIKTKLLLILYILPTILFAQNVSLGDNWMSVPSEATLKTYDSSPISNATAVPNINIPLLNIGSSDKNISEDFSLQYHIDNAKYAIPSSEVGSGWSMMKAGVIYREIEFDQPDELWFKLSRQGLHVKNNFKNIYYYNLPNGVSGKFKIDRDIATNTFELVNLNANKVKIDYTREDNSFTLIPSSFVITDEQGYKFIFNDYSQNRTPYAVGTSSITGLVYKSAFYLTKIVSPNGIDLLLYEYQKDFVYRDSSSLLNYQLCKVKKIISPNNGSLEIEYEYTAALESELTDPYSIKKITLKNYFGEVISGYTFLYEYIVEPYLFVYHNDDPDNVAYNRNYKKRFLSEVRKLDKLNNVIEKTAITNPPFTLFFSDYTLRLTSPYKGTTEYIFNLERKIQNINFYKNITAPPIKSISYKYEDCVTRMEHLGDPYFIPSTLCLSTKVQEDINKGYIKYYYRQNYVGADFKYDVFNRAGTIYDNLTGKGLLIKKEIYNSSNKMVSVDSIDYVIENLPLSDRVLFDYGDQPGVIKKTVTTTKNYFSNNSHIQQTQEVLNNNFYNLSKLKTISPDGSITEKSILYAADVNNTSLVNANIVNIPLTTEIKKNGKILSNTQIKYPNGSFYPSSAVSINSDDNSTKTNVKYDSYDEYGNIQQYTTNIDEASGQGFSTVLIWGYHKTLPIAKIEGAKLIEIGNLANDIIAKSNQDVDADTEKSLLTALDSFKNLSNFKNFQVTTYTHNPLIGITSITPPNGIRVMYKYDDSNQLKQIVDVNGNIVEDYKYNIKP